MTEWDDFVGKMATASLCLDVEACRLSAKEKRDIDIATRYSAGESAARLADEYGLDRRSIPRIARRYSSEIARIGTKFHRATATAIEMAIDGHTVADIEEVTGLGPETVQRVMRQVSWKQAG